MLETTATTAELAAAGLDLDDLSALCAHVLSENFVHPETEVSLSFADEAEMEQLHLEWMDLPGATDVMSFPMDELEPGTADCLAGPGMLGDIVICLPVASAQADAAGHSTAAEVRMLMTHSILHLLGFDHDSPVAEAEMFALQASLLASFVSPHAEGTA